jgi:hypothetical protein
LNTLFLLRDEKYFFSSNMANKVSQDPSFHTNYKKGNLISVKSALEKFFYKKTVHQLSFILSFVTIRIDKLVFWWIFFWIELKSSKFVMPDIQMPKSLDSCFHTMVIGDTVLSLPYYLQ